MEYSGKREHTHLELVSASIREVADPSLALLIALQDVCFPQSSQRGEKIGDLACKIATLIGMPISFLQDLHLLARLHTVGRIVSVAEGGGLPDTKEKWKLAVKTAIVLERVPDLRSVAEVAISVYENWDGSGFPAHKWRGQIPLRSRILRVVFDFIDALDEGRRTREEILKDLAGYSGTRYDPMTFVTLLQIELPHTRIEGGGAGSHLIPLTTLTIGSVLAQDIYTSSGVKLLAKGTIITPQIREVILLRHETDPIVGGIMIVPTDDEE